jgi:hypothetical protein
MAEPPGGRLGRSTRKPPTRQTGKGASKPKTPGPRRPSRCSAGGLAAVRRSLKRVGVAGWRVAPPPCSNRTSPGTFGTAHLRPALPPLPRRPPAPPAEAIVGRDVRACTGMRVQVRRPAPPSRHPPCAERADPALPGLQSLHAQGADPVPRGRHGPRPHLQGHRSGARLHRARARRKDVLAPPGAPGLLARAHPAQVYHVSASGDLAYVQWDITPMGFAQHAPCPTGQARCTPLYPSAPRGASRARPLALRCAALHRAGCSSSPHARSAARRRRGCRPTPCAPHRPLLPPPPPPPRPPPPPPPPPPRARAAERGARGSAGRWRRCSLLDSRSNRRPGAPPNPSPLAEIRHSPRRDAACREKMQHNAEKRVSRAPGARGVVSGAGGGRSSFQLHGRTAAARTAETVLDASGSPRAVRRCGRTGRLDRSPVGES